VCQSGSTTGSAQETQPSWQENYNYQDYWAAQTSQQAFNSAEVPSTEENAVLADSWSREPELGSWSPVFNHEDGQQEVPSHLFVELSPLSSTLSE